MVEKDKAVMFDGIKLLQELWPRFFQKKPVKIVVSILILIILGLILWSILCKPSVTNQKPSASGFIDASDFLKREGTRAPVKLVISDISVTGRARELEFSFESLLGKLEQKIYPLKYLSRVDLLFLDRKLRSKQEAERFFKDTSCNLLVLYGTVKVLSDTLIFDVGFYDKHDFKVGYDASKIVSKVVLDDISVLDRFENILANQIIERLNIFYLFYLDDLARVEDVVKYIKEVLYYYRNFSDTGIDSELYSLYYSYLCSSYNIMGLKDSVCKYGVIGYDVDTTVGYCHPYKAQYLINEFKNNLDSLSEGVRLTKESVEADLLDSANFKEGLAFAYTHISLVYSNRNNPDSSIYYAGLSIDIDSTWYMPFFLKGINYLYKCSTSLGYEFFCKAFERDSTQVLTNYYYAVVLTLRGEFGLARLYFNKAVQLDLKQFMLEYKKNVRNMEYCKYENFDSVKEFTSNVAVYK